MHPKCKLFIGLSSVQSCFAMAKVFYLNLFASSFYWFCKLINDFFLQCYPHSSFNFCDSVLALPKILLMSYFYSGRKLSYFMTKFLMWKQIHMTNCSLRDKFWDTGVDFEKCTFWFFFLDKYVSKALGFFIFIKIFFSKINGGLLSKKFS